MFESIDITDPVINITTPNNTSYYFDGGLIGTCSDDFAITSVSINDTRFVYNTSSSFTDWSFNFNETGIFSIPIIITCIDNSGNNDTILFTALDRKSVV